MARRLVSVLGVSPGRVEVGALVLSASSHAPWSMPPVSCPLPRPIQELPWSPWTLVWVTTMVPSPSSQWLPGILPWWACSYHGAELCPLRVGVGGSPVPSWGLTPAPPGLGQRFLLSPVPTSGRKGVGGGFPKFPVTGPQGHGRAVGLVGTPGAPREVEASWG